MFLILITNVSSFRIGEYLGETRYPPYADWKIKRLDFLVKNRKMPSFLSLIPYITTFILGIGSAFLYKYLLDMKNL